MIKKLLLFIAIVVLLGGCVQKQQPISPPIVPPTGTTPPLNPPAETTRPLTSPFEVELKVINNGQVTRIFGPELEADLKNTTKEDQVFVNESFGESTLLTLTDSNGNVVVGRPHNYIGGNNDPSYQYRTISPDSNFMLLKRQFLNSRYYEGPPYYYEFAWDTEFNHINPGIYKAKVIWNNQIPSHAFNDSGTEFPEIRMWTGSIESNEVEITLP